MAGHWTCVATTVIVAQSSTGASTQKGLLRIGGTLLGCVLGVSIIVFAMPRIENLASLLVVMAVGFGIAGWIVVGSPRSAYAGLQTGMALAMYALDVYGPATELVVGRDRVVGIVAGIIVWMLVDRWLWPVFASREDPHAPREGAAHDGDVVTRRAAARRGRARAVADRDAPSHRLRRAAHRHAAPRRGALRKGRADARTWGSARGAIPIRANLGPAPFSFSRHRRPHARDRPANTTVPRRPARGRKLALRLRHGRCARGHPRRQRGRGLGRASYERGDRDLSDHPVFGDGRAGRRVGDPTTAHQPLGHRTGGRSKCSRKAGAAGAVHGALQGGGALHLFHRVAGAAC